MISVKVNINTQQILRSRGLNKDGRAQQSFTNECFKHMDKYVPYLKGTLKNVATINTDNIVYEMPYARKQYFTNKGDKLPPRGPYWDKVMWNSEGNEILKDVANIVGGEVR